MTRIPFPRSGIAWGAVQGKKIAKGGVSPLTFPIWFHAFKVEYVKDGDMEWAEGVAVAVITQAIKDWVQGEVKGKIYGHRESRNAHSYETARSFLFGDGEWQDVLIYWGTMVRVDIEDIRDLARASLYQARMPRQRYRIYYRGIRED